MIELFLEVRSSNPLRKLKPLQSKKAVLFLDLTADLVLFYLKILNLFGRIFITAHQFNCLSWHPISSYFVSLFFLY